MGTGLGENHLCSGQHQKVMVTATPMHMATEHNQSPRPDTSPCEVCPPATLTFCSAKVSNFAAHRNERMTAYSQHKSG